MGGAIKYLLYYEFKEVIVTVTESLVLSQHFVKPDGECTELVKVLVLVLFTSVNFNINYSMVPQACWCSGIDLCCECMVCLCLK